MVFHYKKIVIWTKILEVVNKVVVKDELSRTVKLIASKTTAIGLFF